MKQRQYPIPDGLRRHFVIHPVELHNGKFAAADVLITHDGGYLSPEGNPTKCQFDSEELCQKACDIHNQYHFGKTKADLDYIESIISLSMKLSMQYQAV